MPYEPPYLWCSVCGQSVDDCVSPVGAHLLCPPTAECRHELCLLLAGDIYAHPAISPNVRKVAS